MSELNKTHADHQAAAWKLEAQPGIETLVHVYAGRQGADSVARGIRTGRIPAYRPAGDFDAIAAMHEDGTAVWARYVKDLELPPLTTEMTVRVPNYGGQTGQEGVHVVEVEISARCQSCGGPRGPVRDDFLVRDGVRHVRDAWDNPCGHKDDYRAVFAEAGQLRRLKDRQSKRHVAVAGVRGGANQAAVDLIAEALTGTPWLSAKNAADTVERAGFTEAADLIWEFIRSNSSRTPSGRAAGLYLMQRDQEALVAAQNDTTGDTK
ncbi:hypothetical protein ACFYSF_22895 [Streptomyces canus]|uniref:hypothetical protein n=1 Tax=Streptomyces canus TaxID=58343 RepID=UPI0036A1C6D4